MFVIDATRVMSPPLWVGARHVTVVYALATGGGTGFYDRNYLAHSALRCCVSLNNVIVVYVHIDQP